MTQSLVFMGTNQLDFGTYPVSCSSLYR